LNLNGDEAQNQWLHSTTDLFLNSLQNNLSEFKLNVLNHVAGYIQKQLKAKEQCVYCGSFLSNMKIVHGGLLINRKNRGGLTLPSVEFEKIVQISETLFVNLLLEAGGNPFKVKNLVDIISLRACSLIQELYPTLLRELDNHVGIMGSHRNLMIKKVVGCYIALHVKHFCKQFNKQSVKVRVQLSKLILFKHQ
jgi:ribosomal protein S17E